MNDENLIGKKFNERTAEEQRSIARAGGIASGKARRRKKAARQAFAAVLASEPRLNNATIKNLEQLGLDYQDYVDIQEIIAAALSQKAMRGDVEAARLCFEMTGEDARSRDQAERRKIDKERVKVERERLEMEQKRAVNEEVSNANVLKGFISALGNAGGEAWDGGFDEPRNIDDSADAGITDDN